ncbi:MAG TPA: hypothetical protein EYQ71_02510 [Candidatus Thioglobus sp.]|nr:hypothetical protein [Candidatus Thioglobus sp.]
MSLDNLIVLIPAIKKKVAFQDDLIKKLGGVLLIQRTINKAIELGVGKQKIHILTDSEEIRVIAERNNVRFYCDPKLKKIEINSRGNLDKYMRQAVVKNENILMLSPYSPLITVSTINQAIQVFIKSKYDALKPVIRHKKKLYDEGRNPGLQVLFGENKETHLIESMSFILFRSELLSNYSINTTSILPWEIKHGLIDIESYQDWWICEKLLKRRRIVFRLIGNGEVGMGHIYRALSLAHEITDHEIIFVSEKKDTIVENKLAGYDYLLKMYNPKDIVDGIIDLNPNLVINDILSTTVEDVLPLQQKDIKFVNFEDLGYGAKMADLTINELYDSPQYNSKNTLWGHDYFFLRDEFFDAKPHCFRKKVDNILLAFGGTDQFNLSSKIYYAIRKLCLERDIKIHIVTGAGYTGYDKLQLEINNEPMVTLTKETGVISSLMEKTQLAITANGRTVYELAHMNIPAIVISQHQREETHGFASEENGFVTLGLFQNKKTELDVLKQLINLLDNEEYRRNLFNRVLKFKFNANKNKIINKIISFL